MGDLPIAPGNGNNCLTVESEDVRTSQIYGDFLGLKAAHPFSLFDSFLYPFNSRVRINNDSFSQSPGLGFTDPHNVEPASFTWFPSDTRHSASSHVKADCVLPALHHLSCSFRTI